MNFLLMFVLLSSSESWSQSLIKDNLKKIDQVHGDIKSGWSTMNKSVDKFFATKSYEEEINESYIRMNLLTQVVDGGPTTTVYGLRLQTDFPNTSKSVKLIIKKEGESFGDGDGQGESLGLINSNTRRGASGQNLSEALEDTSYSAAGRLDFLRDKRWNLYTDLGFRFTVPLDPFVKVRVRRRFSFTKKSILDVIQKLEYFRVNEQSHETVFEYKYALSKKLRLQFTNLFSYRKLDHFYHFSHNLSLLHVYKRTTSFAYSVAAGGESEPVYAYNNYSVATQMRRLIHKDWLFFQISIGANFPRTEDFNARGFVTAGLEVFF